MLKVYAAVALGTIVIADTVLPIGQQPMLKQAYTSMLGADGSGTKPLKSAARSARTSRSGAASDMQKVHSMFSGNGTKKRRRYRSDQSYDYSMKKGRPNKWMRGKNVRRYCAGTFREC